MEKIIKLDGVYYKKLGKGLYGNYFINEEAKKFGIIDDGFNQTQAPIFEDIIPAFKEHFWGLSGGYYNLYSFSGQKVCKKSFKKVTPYSLKFASVSTDGRKFGFVDRVGEWAITPEYEEGMFLGINYFLVKKEGLYGVIDFHQNIIIPFSNEEAPNFTAVMETVLKNRRTLRHWLKTSG